MSCQYLQSHIDEMMMLVRDLPNKDSSEWRTAADELYAATYKFVYKRLHSLGANQSDVPDIAQELYLKVFRARKTFNEHKGSALTWIGRMLVNTWIDYVNKARRRQAYAALSLDDETSIEPKSPYSVENQAVSRATIMEINKYLDSLKEQDDGKNQMQLRVLAFQLLRFHGMSYKEIGEVLNVPPSTITNWVYRLAVDLRNRFDLQHSLGGKP